MAYLTPYELDEAFKKYHADAEHAKKVLGNSFPVPPVSICQCGTCQEAFDTALKLVKQATEHNCLHWATQLAAAMTVITTVGYVRSEANTPNTSLGQTMLAMDEHKRVDTDMRAFAVEPKQFETAWRYFDERHRRNAP